jgi:hypothetical protein
MMIDPFGNQQAGLIDRSFRMMDPVKRRAGLEGGHVIRTDQAQFVVGGQHGPLTPATDRASLSHP